MHNYTKNCVVFPQVNCGQLVRLLNMNIYKNSAYLWNMISKRLSNGQKVAIPRNVIEMEGITLDELSEYFHFSKKSFGLIEFTGFRIAI